MNTTHKDQVVTFGLNESIIEKIKNVFSGFPEIEEVIVYGSRAKGNYKEGSDIDMTVKGNAINLALLNKITLQLDDLMLPYTFDLSGFMQIKNIDLLEHIERVGVSFYKK